jgi:hypothetical protein
VPRLGVETSEHDDGLQLRRRASAVRHRFVYSEGGSWDIVQMFGCGKPTNRSAWSGSARYLATTTTVVYQSSPVRPHTPRDGIGTRLPTGGHQQRSRIGAGREALKLAPCCSLRNLPHNAAYVLAEAFDYPAARSRTFCKMRKQTSANSSSVLRHIADGPAHVRQFETAAVLSGAFTAAAQKADMAAQMVPG